MTSADEAKTTTGDSQRPTQTDLDHQAPVDAASLASLPGMPKIIPFSNLARCGDEVWIENEGKVYRLRRTRQGKLILTK